MRVWMLAACVVPVIALAQSHDDEIRLARSAAPAAISKDAKVYVLENNRYIVAEPGHSGEACFVMRSTSEGVEPQCGDAEADATVLASYRFRVEERLAGKSRDEINREVDEGFKTGRFHAPTRPALVFMLSSAQNLTNAQGKAIGKWEPHLMLYYPPMRNSDLGLVSSNDLSVPGVANEGTPLAALIVVARNWVDPATTQ